jgi:hypothetical protein
MAKSNTRTPAARSDGLIIERLPGELLVYDQERDEAHCLHAEAAAVFDLLDGTRTSAEIAALASEHLPKAVSDAMVEQVLAELSARNLLAEDGAASDGLSRRDLLHRGTLTGVAGAVLITSIAAPVPAAAQSGNTGGCTTGTTCGNEVPCPGGPSQFCRCLESTEGTFHCAGGSITTVCEDDTDCQNPEADGPDCVNGACFTACETSGDCPGNEFCVQEQECITSFCQPLCSSTEPRAWRASGARRGPLGVRLLRR